MSASQYDVRTPRSSSQLQHKLRSSCDACGEAKIRCDRGRPACGRCVAQGANCVYGVSRKAGKPPRKRLAAQSHLPSTCSVEAETATLDIAAGSYDDIDMMFSTPEGSLNVDSPFSASYAAFNSWFPSDNLSVLGAVTGEGAACTSGQSDSASNLAESASAAATPAARRDCTQESKDIMRRLYCADPSNPIPDGVPARSLDLGSVLTRNREVVDLLGRLFRCPCARSPHMAMLYASVMSRVLLWYRQAAWNSIPGAVTASSFPPTPPTLSAQETTLLLSSNTPSKPSDLAGADDNGGVSVLPTPVTVGTFQSDDRNLQTALTNRLILSELRRVRGLIDVFICLGTGTADTQAAGDACSAAGEFNATLADPSLFASLGAWLRSEHGRVEWKARSGLSVLDETNSI